MTAISITWRSHDDSVESADGVTGIHMGSKFRLVLATQAAGNFCRQMTQGLVGGIHHVPVVLGGLRLGVVRFHENSKITAFSGARILLIRPHFDKGFQGFR